MERLFHKHRIVFWYDEEESLRSDFDAIDLAEVEKVEIANNEFGLKYRLLREQPTQKFLVLKSGVQPADRDNWLLDIQLAHTYFRTDKASLWLTELELPYEFRPIVNCHEFFFNSAKRRDQLKDRVKRLTPRPKSASRCSVSVQTATRDSTVFWKTYWRSMV